MEKRFPGYCLIFKASQGVDNEEDPYVKELRNCDIRSHAIPVLTFEFVNLDKLLEKVSSSDDISGFIFSSPRTVEAVCKSVALRHNGDEWWSKMRSQLKDHHVFAVGEATCKNIAELLGLQSKGHESGNADALIHVIMEVVSPGSKPLLFPGGNLRNDTIPTRLSDAGIDVECLTVYETKRSERLEEDIRQLMIDKGFPEYILYFSPSGVRFTLPFLEKLNFVPENIKSDGPFMYFI